MKKTNTLKNPWFYVSAVAVIIIVTLGFNSSGSDTTGNTVDEVVKQQAAPKVIEVSADNDAVLGDPNAPVTIIEFSDYECPFCGRFYQNTMPQLISEYIDTGKAKLIFRDFPLSFHKSAQKASEAAECAGDQGKYYEMHDKIFENQQSITVSDLKVYAEQIGLKVDEFNVCLDTDKHKDEVLQDFRDGQKAGVSGTPSFFINGKMLVGAQPFEAFKKIIDDELA